ncbi:MAG: hypothetical protein FWE61_09365 [Micrococcales bacterium]|nr:hypothetical protein [Micrococcales bacterium]
MTSIVTVRNLDPAVKSRIQQRAARHGRSMEAEIRAILTATPLEDPVVEPHDFVWAVERFQESIAGLDIPDMVLERLPDTGPRGSLFADETPA